MENEMYILCSSSKSNITSKIVKVGDPIHGLRFGTHRPDTFVVAYIGKQFKLDYEKIKWLHSDLAMSVDKNVNSKVLINMLFNNIQLRLANEL